MAERRKVRRPGRRIGRSPWGARDEIGRLNLMTPESRRAALASADPTTVFDLGVELAHGMPIAGGTSDIGFQIRLTRQGDDPPQRDPAIGDPSTLFYQDVVAFPTHCGTHLDCFCHVGADGAIWNGFRAADHLGGRTWHRCGADRIPPIIARGVLLDVPGALGVDALPDRYEITRADVQSALARQGTELRLGDVVISRTGRMREWPDPARVLVDSPGISLEAARYLVEEGGAMILGGDNMSVERSSGDFRGTGVPTDRQASFPVHEYCLTANGVPLLEFADTEALAAAGVHEFCFIGLPLKLAGATGTPLRPIALPFR